ncbi:lipase family protein [Microbacterium sp. RU33B]|uniref:lipase family protein n=1 Tax=Microbacterium sp. RU33B TaxID=1907390 RepID=UPI0009624DCD|nr:lipase family protein [Microbacterium sp. RU33B]SIT86444.1 Uncharacterized membrane protein HdeD, DUF308 family [Microbacterium sp. RU33B]
MSTQTARPAPVRSWLGALPSWLRAVLGLAGVVLGAVIVVRPTASLGALAVLIGAGLVLSGLLELVAGGQGADGEPTPRWRALMAVVWIAAGVFVLLFPDLTVRSVALVVGIAVIAAGVLSVLAGLRPGITADARVASMLLGVAGIGFGLLALSGADITLLVVTVVLGGRLIVVGLLEVWRAVRGRRDRPTATDAAPAAGRWMRTLAVAVALVVGVAAGGLTAVLRGGDPVTDAFYAAPRTVPDEPGQLIRAEAFTRGVPAGAVGWRILYTTTDGDGGPGVASGIVVVPAAGFGEWPVISWAHGATGVAQQCAPSLLAQPFESGAMSVLPEIVANGWALVQADGSGRGAASPPAYLVGDPSGRADLDAVRAARQIPAADLGGQTVAWGWSDGGGTALWAGATAAAYAPDVPLAGVAALAPMADPAAVLANLPTVSGGSVVASFTMAAYAARYDDVTYGKFIRPESDDTARRMAEHCLAGPGLLVPVLAEVGQTSDPDLFAVPPTEGAFGARLAENVPPPTITVPLLLAQGKDDVLVPPAAQDAFVGAACGAGQIVDYRLYAGLGHVDLVAAASLVVPQLMEWTKARLSGEPGIAGCNRAEY